MAKKQLKRKKAQPQDVAYPELENALHRMRGLQEEGLKNREEFLTLESWALDFCRKKGIETYDRGPFKATPVFPMGEIMDWDGLKDALPADKWKQILGEPQPDKSKLEALMELGLIDPKIVQEFITEKPIKPHVKITPREVVT